MAPTTKPEDRVFHIAWWNPDPRVVYSTKLQIERLIKKLGTIEFKEVKAPDDPRLLPCDLLIVATPYVPEEEFPQWLSAQEKRMQREGNIWIPALFVADVEFDVLRDNWRKVQGTNWYFDIVSPSHLSSLPVRVANLLRIHDHLQELHRYGEEVDSLQKRVQEVERLLKTP